MKSVEDACDLFIERRMFCKYFLMQMGIKIENETNLDNIPKHTLCHLEINDNFWMIFIIILINLIVYYQIQIVMVLVKHIKIN